MALPAQERLYTVEDLWELAHSGEDRFFELIEGEIVEMPPPGDRHGVVASELHRLIANHVVNTDLGDVVFETGFILSANTVCAPDVGFLAKARLTPMTGKYYPVAPDLAVEVVSPSDSPGPLRRKVALYLRNGARAVWVVYPNERFVDVYHADGMVNTYEGDETLDGGDILPGFSVRVSDIFQRVRD